ncbi:MAG: GHMP kinase [Cardiobacteriales bacterium]|nr:MAG: GHMP kinase [Cardiobacteriales bacterium]
MGYCAKAPGKLILSGEHSVVYDAPAIVAAIAEYTQVCFHPIHRSNSIKTVFKGLPIGKPYPLTALRKLKHKLDRRFEQFIRGELSVSHILHRPDDLAVYALATFFQHLPMPGKTSRKHLPIPGRLSSESTLPLGAGMGSSAAAIAATIVLYEHLLEHPLTLTQRFERIRFCERLQHGKGSALDAAAVTYGNILYLENGQPKPLDIQLDNHWYWILQGIPTSSTGECVSHVRQHFGHDQTLWQAFSDCTQALTAALENHHNPKHIIRENHQLLRRIGVVPDATNALIKTITDHGGGAKISGAGSVHGQRGGIIIVYHDDPEAMQTLLKSHPHRRWGKLTIAPQGARLCDNPCLMDTSQ